MTANPSAAEGLGVCSEAQYAAESLTAHGCPQASKLGTLEARPRPRRPSRATSPGRQAPSISPSPSRQPLRLPARRLHDDPRPRDWASSSSCAAQIEPTKPRGQLITTVRGHAALPASARRGPPALGPPRAADHPAGLRHLRHTGALYPSSGGRAGHRDPSFQISLRARRRALPRRGACPSPRALKPARPTTPPGATRPSRCASPARRRTGHHPLLGRPCPPG